MVTTSVGTQLHYSSGTDLSGLEQNGALYILDLVVCRHSIGAG